MFLTLPFVHAFTHVCGDGVLQPLYVLRNYMRGFDRCGSGASVKNATLDFRDDIDCYASSVITINMMLYVAMVLFVNVFHGAIEEATGFSLFVLNVLLLHALGSHFLEFYNEKLSMEFRYRSVRRSDACECGCQRCAVDSRYMRAEVYSS